MIRIITVGIGIATLVVGIGMIGGWDTFRAWLTQSRHAWSESESNATKLAKVENLIRDLEQASQDNRRSRHEYGYRIERARESIVKDTRESDYLDRELRAAKETLAADTDTFMVHGETFTRVEVEAEANRKALRAMALMQRAENASHMITTLEEAVASLDIHHANLMSEISALRGQWEALSILSEQTLVEASTMSGAPGMDPSLMDRAHRLMDEVQADLVVTRQMVAESKPTPGITFTSPMPRDRSPFDRYFAGNAEEDPQ